MAVMTRMPEVTPVMIAWWFGTYMQTTEHYQRWHPRDHVWMAWKDKQADTHVGAKHLVHEYIGGKFNKFQINFVPHQEYLGDHLDTAPGAVAICARPGFLERPIDTGRMIHLALPTAWCCELHSRFWLGYVQSRSGNRLIEKLANTRLMRHLLVPQSLGQGLAVHCHEEMSTLAGFLPSLYAQEQETN